MKTVVPNPHYLNLTEDEILAALDAYETQFGDEDDENNPEESLSEEELDEDECDEDELEEMITPEDPVVREVERLVAAYAARFDSYCREHGEVSEEALLYKPKSAIERVAFQIFTEALHDSLMDEDDD